MSELRELIAAEIANHGPLSFSEYMDFALYHPDLGFYARGGAGRRGRDFITSPEVGPLFGAVVARRLDTWWETLGRPDPFTFVEAGAGRAMLTKTVLAAGPQCADALRCVAVEISSAQREQHPPGVLSRADLPPSIEAGVILANELLDNLGFDVFDWDPDRGWSEVRVGGDSDHFDEVLLPVAGAPMQLDPQTPACRVPQQGRAARWVVDALERTHRGGVVVIDYCVPAYPVDRTWLRSYRSHASGVDPLVEPGSQDITNDVAVDQLVAAVGVPGIHSSQGDWLRVHGIDDLVAEGRRVWAERAAAPDVEALTARSRASEATALVDPVGLGAFTVLEWSKP